MLKPFFWAVVRLWSTAVINTVEVEVCELVMSLDNRRFDARCVDSSSVSARSRRYDLSASSTAGWKVVSAVAAPCSIFASSKAARSVTQDQGS